MPGSWFDTREWFDGNRDGFGDPVWGLEECCGVEESLFLTFYVVYAAVFFILNRWTIFKPMRLLTVFLHEFGHATGASMNYLLLPRIYFLHVIGVDYLTLFVVVIGF